MYASWALRGVKEERLGGGKRRGQERGRGRRANETIIERLQIRCKEKSEEEKGRKGRKQGGSGRSAKVFLTGYWYWCGRVLGTKREWVRTVAEKVFPF